jgi:sec-independent protein translocase protein TatA
MSGSLGGWTGLVLIVVVLLLFGAPKLPALAKSVGQSLKIFKSEVRPDADAGESDTTASSEGYESPKE